MAYDPIANSEIDTDSPITANLMTRVRDNPLEVCRGAPTALADGEGVAIDYDFGAGAQFAIITDELDPGKTLVPDGVGGAEWGSPAGVGGGKDGITKKATAHQWRVGPTTETLENMTSVTPSDSWGTGLRADVGRARASLFGWHDNTGDMANMRFSFYEDDGVAITELKFKYKNVIMMSVDLVEDYVYILHILGALAWQPGDGTFNICS